MCPSIRQKRFSFGICAMNRKVNASPMQMLIEHMKEDFDIIIFPEEDILNKPIEEWPVVDVLMAFYSTGFPLEKAISYSELRKPMLINDLKMQRLFFDRLKIHEMLTKENIPVPRYVVALRDKDLNDIQPFEEGENYIKVGDQVLQKPFVEKPLDAEDHRVRIYYPRTDGGGMKELFRKNKANQSSIYYPNVNTVRRDASYIYEEFIRTEGTDVKVYSVGTSYFHGEARKSPTVDGKVERDETGKEIRYPILLNASEKDICRKVSILFKQTICGFDMLREGGQSFVCDVNGVSFVKKNRKFWADASHLIKLLIYKQLQPSRLTKLDWEELDRPKRERLQKEDEENQQKLSRGLPVSSSSSEDLPKDKEDNLNYNNDEQLRCVICICRHGDRTPKQKLKFKVNSPTLLDLFNIYSDDNHKELKLKQVDQLNKVLSIVQQELISLRNIDIHTPLHLTKTTSKEKIDNIDIQQLNTIEQKEKKQKEELINYKIKLQQVKAVLQQGGGFRGFNRKVQMRPLKWSLDDMMDSLNDEPLSSGSICSSSHYMSLPSSPQLISVNASSSTTSSTNANPEPSPGLIHGDEENINGIVQNVIKLPSAASTINATTKENKSTTRALSTNSQNTKLSKSKSLNGATEVNSDTEICYNSKSDDDYVFAKTKNNVEYKINTNTTRNLYNHVTDCGSAEVLSSLSVEPSNLEGGESIPPISILSTIQSRSGSVNTIEQLNSNVTGNRLIRSMGSQEKQSSSKHESHALHHSASITLPLPSEDETLSLQSFKLLRSKADITTIPKEIQTLYPIPQRYDFENNQHIDRSTLDSSFKTTKGNTRIVSNTTVSVGSTSPNSSTTISQSPSVSSSLSAQNSVMEGTPAPVSYSPQKPQSNPSTNTNSLLLIHSPDNTPMNSSPSTAITRSPSISLFGGSSMYRKDEIRWRRSFEHNIEEEEDSLDELNGKENTNAHNAHYRKDNHLEVTEALFIMKWGGILTQTGRKQAMNLGEYFRKNMYGSSQYFLRLHNSYRHDLKIYSSEEGRVRTTAAAFTKQCLDIDTEHLTPIMVSMVRCHKRAHSLLDGVHEGVVLLQQVKVRLYNLLLEDGDVTEDLIRRITPANTAWMVKSLKEIGNTHKLLDRIYEQIKKLNIELKKYERGPHVNMNNEYTGHIVGFENESLFLVIERWNKLMKDIYDTKQKTYDLSKIPTLYDCVKYDIIHNSALIDLGFKQLYHDSKLLADIIVPQEYGIDIWEKLVIGRNIVKNLLRKIDADLSVAAYGENVKMQEKMDLPNDYTAYQIDERYTEDSTSPMRPVYTRMFFTSESHLHGLLNIIRYGKATDGSCLVTPEAYARLDAVSELDYLCNIVLRLYENSKYKRDDYRRYRVELYFSPGCLLDETTYQEPMCQPYILLNNNLTFHQVEKVFNCVINFSEEEIKEFYSSH